VTDKTVQAIGPYDLVAELGAGGMGVVYSAVNRFSGQRVAVKILRETASPAFAKRFLQEAAALARLSHPNIIAIHHFDVHAGSPYLVMDFVNDGSLRARLDTYRAAQRLPPLELALSLTLQAARALAAAHAQGIIHRDIKPENLLLQRVNADGPPRHLLKLSDFGIAKLADGDPELSRRGFVPGTPRYMAPEQVRGEPASPQTDIYALGLVLYELTTGLPPFGGSRDELLQKQLHQPPPPPSANRPDLPAPVEQIIMRCLEKDPAMRFASAGALAQALLAALNALPNSASPPPVPTPAQASTPPPAPPITAPAASPYEILDPQPLGTGGMAEVFRARDTRTGREVALKRLLQGISADPAFRTRFTKRDEVIASALHHPGIVEVFETGEFDGRLFVAMELMPDGSLRALLDRRAHEPITLALALDLMRQAAEALAYAHEHNIIHRDIKPENLLLRRQPPPAPPANDELLASLILAQSSAAAGYTLKLGDFGLATIAGASRLTQSSHAVGTQAYMAPEQYRGQTDKRSDIFSLGVVLYELVTGRRPYEGDNAQAVMYKITFTSPEPPRTYNPALPPAVEAIIVKCLERDPLARYQSAAELAEALRAAGAALDSQVARSMVIQVPPALDRGDETIAVALDRVTLALTPGLPATVTVGVTNLGTQVDHFRVTVSGVPGAWVRPEVQELRLLPDAHASVLFSLVAPRAPESRAGEYPVTIRAESTEARPGVAGLAAGRWTVLPFAGAQLAMRYTERSGQRAAEYPLKLHNTGNSPARYTLEGSDGAGALAYHFYQGDADVTGTEIALEAGATADLRLRVNAAPHRLGAPRPHDFVVTAKGGDESATARARFTQTPLISTLMASVAVPVLLALCGLGGVWANGTYVEGPRNATATAEARGAVAVGATATAEYHATATAVWVAGDDDRDLLSNDEERALGTLPNNRDTDADGLSDGDEVRTHKTEPLKADTDGDGLNDGVEIERGTDPLKADTDGDGQADNIDPAPLALPTSTYTPTATPTTVPTPSPTDVPPTDVPPTDVPIPPTDTPTATATATATNTPTVVPPLGASADDYIGILENSDPNTRGMTRVIVRRVDAETVSFQGFGSCSPTDCDWGVINVRTDTLPVLVGVWDFGWKTTKLTLRYVGSEIHAETFDDYTEADGRTDRTSNYVLVRR
jgi:eukaryotic-like serine/threonine-protein kinase